MNGDAKSPQHTVVHPMYVSYTSIPTTSASATMQSNKQLQLQHQQQMQQNSLQFYHQQEQQQQSHQQRQYKQQTSKHSNNNNHSNCNSYNNTLNNVHHQADIDTATINHNMHNTTTHLTHNTSGNSNSNNHSGNNSSSNHSGSNKRHSESSQRRKLRQQNPNLNPIKPNPSSNLNPVRTAANSNLNSVSPMSISMSMSPQSAQTTPSLSYASLQNSNPQLANSLSNSNYSIFQHVDNNMITTATTANSSHFARIHQKPKLPDVKYSQLPLDRLSRNLEEDEDNFSLPSENGGVTYVPFQSPTPNSLFEHTNNNISSQSSPNNNQPYVYDSQPHKSMMGYSPRMLRGGRQLPRPTQIPLPTVPIHSCQELLSPPSPPLPPAPRPHIFQPRLGQAPYPDLSPEIAEKYAMPTQHVVPGSPMVRRSQRRQPRPQPTQANFCDIVRTQSDDRLEVELHQSMESQQAAPHVNRRSGKKTRPRSFCNSIVGAQA